MKSAIISRLDTVVFDMPAGMAPRRDPRDDISTLALSLLSTVAPLDGPMGFTTAAMRRLQRHRWSGGVHELRRVVEVAVSVCDGAMVDEIVVAFALGTGESEHQGSDPCDAPGRTHVHEPEVLQTV